MYFAYKIFWFYQNKFYRNKTAKKIDFYAKKSNILKCSLMFILHYVLLCAMLWIILWSMTSLNKTYLERL